MDAGSLQGLAHRHDAPPTARKLIGDEFALWKLGRPRWTRTNSERRGSKSGWRSEGAGLCGLGDRLVIGSPSRPTLARLKAVPLGRQVRRDRDVDTKATVTVNTLKSCLEAFNRHDLDEVMTFFGDHPVLEMPRGPHPWGTRAEGRVQDGCGRGYSRGVLSN